MRFVFLLIAVLISTFSFGQLGGKGVYAFMQLPGSSHVSALGGNNISVVSNEPSFVIQNPALLNDSLLNIPVINTSKYFADIYYGSAGYAFHNRYVGNIFIGFQHFNYGKFAEFDEVGNRIGSFSAADYALYLSTSHSFSDSSFSWGVALKPILSQYESYSSYGLVSDWGLLYHNTHNLWTIALTLKNLGYQLKSYYDNHHEPIDADWQLGITKKLKHAPLRLSLTFQHIEQWNLAKYVDERQSENTTVLGEQPIQRSAFERNSDEFLRHIIVATDIVLSKNFYVALGYNFQRRKELGTDTRMATTGLSWGFGFKIYRFQFHYARAAYNLAGASNMITLSSRINDWRKKE